ncbi:MAG: tetratricopeptide repeat protein [Acidobacteria bacterium]|nr:tetratricopeptide repeat protein [Acidobacteriota bacterium]MBI3657657.1 tetratricopeptide repeat protein [Acidobacteriota bacterium]
MSNGDALIRDGGDSSDLFTESGCLNDLALAIYVSRSTTAVERKTIEEHLFRCEECVETVGHIGQAIRDSSLEDDTVAHALPAPDINKYFGQIEPLLRQRPVEMPKRPTLVKLGANPFALRWASAALVLMMLFGGLLYWMGSAQRRHHDLYALGMENLKSVPLFQTTSGLRLVGAPMSPRWERGESALSKDHVTGLDQALAYFLQALGARPKDLPTRLNLGKIYLAKQQPALAFKQYEEALKLNKNLIEAINGLGLSLYEQAITEADPYRRDEKLGASSQRFAEVLAINPEQPDALYNLALTFYALGNKAQTLETIERYSALDSQSPWAEKLFLIRDKLRLISYEFFQGEVGEAFQSGRWDRLAQLISRSPHAIWCIKKSLTSSVEKEMENDLAGAKQDFAKAAAVENAYRAYTGDLSYQRLIEYYRKLSYAQKRLKYQATNLTNAAFTRYIQGDLASSLELAAAALKIFPQGHDYWQESYIYHLMGNGYFFQSEYDKALAAYSAMARVAEHSQDREDLADALTNISVICQMRGNYFEIKACLRQALLLAETLNNAQMQARAYNALGNMYRELGDLEESLRSYAESLKRNRRMGDQLGELDNLEHISLLYQRGQQYEKAIGFL